MERKIVNWNKYYNDFYNLSASNQYYLATKLLNYGTNDQVIEVAKNFKMKNIERTSLFIKKSILLGVKFLPDQIIECAELINKDTLQLMAKKTVTPYTNKQILLIKPFINRITLYEISKISESDLPNMQYQILLVKERKPSILLALGFAFLGIKVINMLTDEQDK